jgi:hypothetical protein
MEEEKRSRYFVLEMRWGEKQGNSSTGIKVNFGKY